jgi:hypothetical protein
METRSNHILVGSVVLAMLAGLLIFIVWLAGLSNKATKCFDIYFAQGVGGLNKGSTVSATLDASLRDFFLGPYTQDIVNHARFPVLSIRPRLSVNATHEESAVHEHR